MMGSRLVSAEILDGLNGEDPEARRSRRDLQRIHRLMGTRSILRRALSSYETYRRVPLRVLELGAGDGTVMLGFARRIHAAWPPVELTLLDRLDLVSPGTLAGYGAVGWKASTAVVDVLDWAETAAERFDLIVANLFLHHFNAPQLQKLLGAIASRSKAFFACEPRRSSVPLLASHLVGVIGANAVTRADSVASVRAGFVNAEIGDLWPPGAGHWRLREYSAGLFSHCFHATRDHDGSGPDDHAS